MLAALVLPTQATDFSGYVEAPDDSYGWMAMVMFDPRVIAGGRAQRWVYRNWLVNLGDVKMNDAIYLVKITQVRYHDEFGVSQSTTDPAEIEQLVHLENSDEMWQDSYVLWIGDIPVWTDQTRIAKTVTFNYWLAGNVATWSSETSLWYLP